MEYGLYANGVQLEYDTLAKRTSENGCAIQIARRILDQSSFGITTVPAAFEFVEDSLQAVFLHRKHRSTKQRKAISVRIETIIVATMSSRSVKLPGPLLPSVSSGTGMFCFATHFPRQILCKWPERG